MRIILDIVEGPLVGKSFEFEHHEALLLGRSNLCGRFRLGDDVKMSREHAILEVNPPTIRIRDLMSTNHTYLNGQQIIESEVGIGDEVKLGSTKIRFRLEESELEQVYEGEDAFFESGTTSSQPAGDRSDSAEMSGSRNPAVCKANKCARCGRDSNAVVVFPGDRANDLYVCASCKDEMDRNGEKLPGYKLIRQISRGAMGVLWLAEETLTGETVAIKTMIPDLTSSWRMVQMFLRESRISLELNHPNIVKFRSAGQFDGQLYIVMEYIEGPNAEVVRNNCGGKMPVRDVVDIGLQVLDALEYAHQQNVVHRDIKPGNIMLCGESGNYTVKVADFGLSRNYRAAGMSGITQENEVRGSIPYAAPEQVLCPRDSDQRTDIFNLGATLYHLLCGEFVYKFDQREAPLVTVVRSSATPIQSRLKSIPKKLAAIIDRAVKKEPQERFQTAAEMKSALSGVLRGMEVQS